MKPYHRVSQLHDVCELAPKLRYEDKREVETLGHTGEIALCLAYSMSSICRSIIDKRGQVVGMYGVTPVDHIEGRVWMLGSDGLVKIKTAFLKESRTEVEMMNKAFPHLCNYIDSRNELHIKWILWCGFKIIGETMINGYKFYEFSRIAWQD